MVVQKSERFKNSLELTHKGRKALKNALEEHKSGRLTDYDLAAYVPTFFLIVWNLDKQTSLSNLASYILEDSEETLFEKILDEYSDRNLMWSAIKLLDQIRAGKIILPSSKEKS